jgi:hypothetical protein
VLLSLIIQGLFAYLIGYFAPNFAVSDKFVVQGVDANGAAVTYVGMAAAAHSQAPIGDMMRLFGDSLLDGIGFGLTVTMAVTVALAILGTMYEIAQVIQNATAAVACQRLVELALERGADDNLSVQVVKVVELAGASLQLSARKNGFFRRTLGLIGNMLTWPPSG